MPIEHNGEIISLAIETFKKHSVVMIENYVFTPAWMTN